MGLSEIGTMLPINPSSLRYQGTKAANHHKILHWQVVETSVSSLFIAVENQKDLTMKMMAWNLLSAWKLEELEDPLVSLPWLSFCYLRSPSGS